MRCKVLVFYRIATLPAAPRNDVKERSVSFRANVSERGNPLDTRRKVVVFNRIATASAMPRNDVKERSVSFRANGVSVGIRWVRRKVLVFYRIAASD